MADRTCRRCGKSKPLDDQHFYRSATSSTGFQSRCKKCDNDKYGRVHALETRLSTDRPFAGAEICRVCTDIPERRPLTGCWKCKRPHVAVPRARAVDQRGRA